MNGNKNKIWLSSPHLGGAEQHFVNDAFQQNWIAPLGPNVSGFENDLENYLGNTHYVSALSSGTSALHLALIMLGVGAGDEVLCQSFTFIGSINPVVYVGAIPVFIDSEKTSRNICPVFLEEAIISRTKAGKKPKAIIAVHLYGMPYLSDAVMAVALKYNIPVIEDSAEALGSKLNGEYCGTLANFSVLSFNGNKIITTSGGGALVSRTAAEKDKAIFLATQAKEDKPYYEHNTIGYNYRMSNICAGIGRGQMQVLPERVAQKRTIFKKYASFFKQWPQVSFIDDYAEGVFSNHWLTVINIDAKDGGDARVQGLLKKLETENIEARRLWKPMHLQPVFKNNLFFGETIAADMFSTGLCLPSGTNMNDQDWDRIFSCLTGFFK